MFVDEDVTSFDTIPRQYDVTGSGWADLRAVLFEQTLDEDPGVFGQGVHGCKPSVRSPIAAMLPA